jgi:DNA uptake protein ComE-like DNA-binding protein
LLLIAGALAALAQYLLPAPSAVAPVETARPAIESSAPPPVRQILTLPETSRAAPPPVAQAPAPAPQPAPSPAPALRPAVPATAPDPSAPPAAAAPVQLPVDAAVVPVPPASAAPEGEAEVAEARTTEGPAAVALVDLNSASVADLNRLRGGGNIGRAIAAKRPYAAVSDLLTKRVLSRSVFERIREQVTVR